jgi:hypothetical protein
MEFLPFSARVQGTVVQSEDAVKRVGPIRFKRQRVSLFIQSQAGKIPFAVDCRLAEEESLYPVARIFDLLHCGTYQIEPTPTLFWATSCCLLGSSGED